MKIAVLGATGGLGGGLVQYFSGKNFAVLAQGRNSARLKDLQTPAINCVAGELSDASVLEAIIAFGPDAILNAAGKSGFSRGKPAFATANIETAKQAIMLARASNDCRLIHFSSPSVSYRAHDCFAVKEDKAFSPPVSAYAWSRQLSELSLIAADDLPITVIRLRSAYGHGAASPLQSLRQAIQQRQFIPLVRGGNVAIDVVHVDDVMGSVDAILQTPQNRGCLIFNVAGGEALTFKQIVDGVSNYERLKPKWLPVPGIAMAFAAPISELIMLGLPENREPKMSAHIAGALLYSQTLDISKIKQATGWSPQISFDEALLRRML